MAGWFRKVLSGQSARKTRAELADVNARREAIAQMSDAEVAATAKNAFKGDTLQDKAAFLAAVREGAQRTLGLSPFDVQLEGTARLLERNVIQMATGEGKTLVGAMAAVGYGLMGKRVHSITVNSYLAGRDADWMRPMMDFFGLTVASIGEKMTSDERREAYRADIVFGAINEIGFDVLRDHTITSRDQQVQPQVDVAIVDEADSVMVDEALVPLVLAGSAPGAAPTGRINDIVRHLDKDKDYSVDGDRRNVFLTDNGAEKVERQLGIPSLYDPSHIGTTLVQVNVALHARELLVRDIHYIIRDGKVALVDNSRGRVADLQRWPDGLQAAVEAKEGLDVTDGGRVLDTITIQALLGRYHDVCGMTGTALAAEEQLRQFYSLGVAEIDPNVPCQREDEPDRIFINSDDRLRAVVDYVAQQQQAGRPVLVGTQNVADSEDVSEQLAKIGVDSVVLNAKNDELEAGIIADAGLPGKVTVSTQMAGRGTDIKLGGADEAFRDQVVAAGGLAVVGVGRHRSERLDNQLRGRAGRQGDPGSSVFFVAMDEDMVSVGGAGEDYRGRPDGNGQLLEKRAYSFVDHCQRVTEGQMLQIHANTWKYNKLINDQRAIIDERRAALLDTDAAWQDMSRRSPQRAQELSSLPDDVLHTAARDIMLYHLDEHWAEHLAYLDDIRESIHLRALARESPIDEFHRMSIGAFKTIVNQAVDDAVTTFNEVVIDEDGAHLEDNGLRRPSSTWTYMVNDNPLAGNGGSVIGSVVNMFR